MDAAKLSPEVQQDSLDAEAKQAKTSHYLPREQHYKMDIEQTHSTMELDFSNNPNLILDFVGEEQRGLSVGLLINQDSSCWLTNLGADGFAEVYRSEGQLHRKLGYNQVAYVRQGDWVAFGGRLFRLLFGFSTVQLKAIQADFMRKQNLQ